MYIVYVVREPNANSGWGRREHFNPISFFYGKTLISGPLKNPKFVLGRKSARC